MISFQLPAAEPTTYKHISYSASTVLPKQLLSHTLSKYLYEIKEKIAHKEKEWDVYKKYTNPYEYIHTIIPGRKYAVSSYKALSRSYFKMVEMIRGFALLPKRTFLNNAPIRTFHLAEGPGGFIEAVRNFRSNRADEYWGMTILKDEKDDNVPAWRKSDYFLRSNPNVRIENGADGTGNLLRIANFDHCVAKYAGTMDFVTADGGFDFSEDFNHQELTIVQLLWGQIAYALAMQRVGGHFVLKMFDSFFEPTVDMLVILSSFYEEVHIAKLRTSRIGNSEKYVVCKRFRQGLNPAEYIPAIREAFIQCNAVQNNDAAAKPLFSARFLRQDYTVNRLFLSKLEEINTTFGQQQIENIHYTLTLIDKAGKFGTQDKIEPIVSHNIQKCVQWCVEHGVFYNNHCNSVNC